MRIRRIEGKGKIGPPSTGTLARENRLRRVSLGCAGRRIQRQDSEPPAVEMGLRGPPCLGTRSLMKGFQLGDEEFVLL